MVISSLSLYTQKYNCVPAFQRSRQSGTSKRKVLELWPTDLLALVTTGVDNLGSD